MSHEIKKAVLTLENGESQAETELNLPSGTSIHAHALIQDSNEPILIGLFDNGTEVVPTIPATLYDGGFGSFEQRAWLVSSEGGGDYTVRAQTLNGQPLSSGDNTIIVTFKIHKKDNC